MPGSSFATCCPAWPATRPPARRVRHEAHGDPRHGLPARLGTDALGAAGQRREGTGGLAGESPGGLRIVSRRVCAAEPPAACAVAAAGAAARRGGRVAAPAGPARYLQSPASSPPATIARLAGAGAGRRRESGVPHAQRDAIAGAARRDPRGARRGHDAGGLERLVACPAPAGGARPQQRRGLHRGADGRRGDGRADPAEAAHRPRHPPGRTHQRHAMSGRALVLFALAIALGLPAQRAVASDGHSGNGSAATTTAVSMDAHRDIVLAVANEQEPPSTRAGSSLLGYTPPARYGAGQRALSVMDALKRHYGLREIAGWPIKPLG